MELDMRQVQQMVGLMVSRLRSLKAEIEEYSSKLAESGDNLTAEKGGDDTFESQHMEASPLTCTETTSTTSEDSDREFQAAAAAAAQPNVDPQGSVRTNSPTDNNVANPTVHPKKRWAKEFNKQAGDENIEGLWLIALVNKTNEQKNSDTTDGNSNNTDNVDVLDTSTTKDGNSTKVADSEGPEIEALKKYSCDGCENKFAHLDLLRAHQHEHYWRDFFKCSLCRLPSYKNIVELDQHIQEKHPGDTSQKLFECLTCHHKFDHKFKMIRHFYGVYCEGGEEESIETPHNPTAASEPKVVKRIWQPFLDQNNNKANEPQPEEQVQVRVPKTSSTKLKHTKGGRKIAKKPDTNLPYGCNRCSFKASKFWAVKTHQYAHLKMKCFACCFCNRSLKCSETLLKHFETQHPHEKVRTFGCTSCPKTLYHIQHLVEHVWSEHHEGLHVIELNQSCANSLH